MAKRLVKGLVLGTGALALSALALSSAMGSVMQANRAMLVAQLLPTNGFAQAEVAQDLSLVVLNPEVQEPDPQAVTLARSYARKALFNEPLAQKALRSLALIDMRLDENKRPEAREMMHESAAISKRDRATMLWLVDDYGRQGDVETALGYLDMTLRRGGVSESYLLPIVARSLAEPGSITVLEKMLAARPPWANSFWLAVVKVPEVLPAAARLRTRLARRGIESTEETDTVLLTGLVRQGAYADAYDLRSVLAEGKGDAILRNGSFAETPRYAPFDWELTSTGDYGGDILAQQKALLLNALPDAGGVVARQFVRLNPGNYRLSAALGQAPASGTRADLILSCANGARSAEEVVKLPLDKRSVSGEFRVSEDSCGFYWLEFKIFVERQSTSSDVLVDAVSIDRIGG